MIDENRPEAQRILARIAAGWPELLEVNPGWLPLLGRLDEQLSAIAPDYVVLQCKSKFGALSFYAQPSPDPEMQNDEFAEIIRAAEWESTRLCELCGGPAQQYTIRLWSWTLCTDHARQIAEEARG